MSPHRIASMSKADTRGCRPRRAHARPHTLVRIASASLVLVAAISSTASVHAATVTALQGQVLVNGGTGYRLVDGSTQLGPGGTVVANPGAVARVVYGDGCKVTVQPGSVYLIGARAPCRTGAPTTTAGLTDNLTSNKGEAPGMNPWLIGGAALAVGGGAAYAIMSISP